MSNLATLYVLGEHTWILGSRRSGTTAVLTPRRLAAWFTNIYRYDQDYLPVPIVDWANAFARNAVNIGVCYEFDDLVAILRALTRDAPGLFYYYGRVSIPVDEERALEMAAANPQTLRIWRCGSSKLQAMYAASCAESLDDLRGLGPDPCPPPEFIIGWSPASDPITKQISAWWSSTLVGESTRWPFGMPTGAQGGVELAAIDDEVEGIGLFIGNAVLALSVSSLRYALGEGAILATADRRSAWRWVMGKFDLRALRAVDRPLPFDGMCK